MLSGIFLVTTPSLTPEERAVKKEPWSWSKIKAELNEYKENVPVRREFYLLFLTRISITVIIFTITTYYKSFGLTFIDSDSFISNYIGTVSGIMQWTSRMVYGFAFDRIPYKVIMCWMQGVLTVVIGTLYFTSELGRGSFLVWMYLIYLNFPGFYALVPGRASLFCYIKIADVPVF